jgi:hypothetical protein|tara:strand:+ start:1206 stop:1520 length:315 start_codon:yes stop_codon:yes gene_type:complete
MKLSKQKLKQIIKEELEAALDEGYKGPIYKRRPDLRPDYKGTGGPHPDYPPKPHDPERTLKAMLDVLMMSTAGIRTDDFMRLREMAIEKGMSPEEAEQRIQPRR